jgi:hypothetical protein
MNCNTFKSHDAQRHVEHGVLMFLPYNGEDTLLKFAPLSLCNIGIPSLTILLPFQKFLLNQSINVLLDPTHFQRPPTPRRFDCLCHQLCVTDPLPCLQDSYNGCLRLIIPVRCDPFMSLFVLCRRLLELYRVDLDAVFRVDKRCIERECIGRTDFT